MIVTFEFTQDCPRALSIRSWILRLNLLARILSVMTFVYYPRPESRYAQPLRSCMRFNIASSAVQKSFDRRVRHHLANLVEQAKQYSIEFQAQRSALIVAEPIPHQ